VEFITINNQRAKTCTDNILITNYRLLVF